MAAIDDLWYQNGVDANGKRIKVKSLRYGIGSRYRIRYIDNAGRQRSKSFARKVDAERSLPAYERPLCLVPDCGGASVTKRPVCLCASHLSVIFDVFGRRKQPPAHQPIVYFARMGSRVKIGWTTNVQGRITGLSLPLSSVVLQLPGGQKEERELHKRFASSRIGSSEWFEITPELESFMAECAASDFSGVASVPPEVQNDH